MPNPAPPVPAVPAPVLRFGEFELDRLNHQLRRGGRPIRLQEQPYKVLEYLLEHAGRVVTREELRERVWPSSVFVDFDHGLNNAIARLRETLGDDTATPRYIETVPRVGYRFAGQVAYPIQISPAAVATDATAGPEAIASAAPEVARPHKRGVNAAWILGVASMVVIAALVFLWRARTPSVTPKPAVAPAIRTATDASRRGTRDAEAYRLYMMGLTFLRGRGTDRNAERAGQLFADALARDPEYADAQAGLAQAYFHDAWAVSAGVEQSVRAGSAAAARAMELDANSSEALMARAVAEAWRYRFRDDSASQRRSTADFRRALELDPANSAIYFNFGRTAFWDQPELAQQMFERALTIDPLWDAARSLSALLLSARGLPDAARSRLQELSARSLDPQFYGMAMGTLDAQSGDLDKAAVTLQGPAVAGDLQLWGIYLSLGDKVAAGRVLDGLQGDTFAETLRDAARFLMDAHYVQAFATLERHCDDYPLSLVLDVPDARLALIVGRPERARALLLRRLPDLAAGAEPVSARNVMPALDLVLAYQHTGDGARAQELLKRVTSFLEGQNAPHWPMFQYVQARAHALAGEPAAALQSLAGAYDAGFRLLWALDLEPQPLYYLDPVDADPAFVTLRHDPKYQKWRDDIRTDNASQLEQLRSRQSVARTG